MEQNQITSPGNLLGDDGCLMQRGYSTQAVLNYNRAAIKARPWRIKEWDFYQVANDDFCLQMTIGHVSYAGNVSVKLFEFATGQHYEITKMLVLPFNRLHMPASAEQGNLTYRQKNMFIEFQVSDEGRRLICKATGKNSPPISVDVELSQPDPTSMVIATPFDEHPAMFYYNHKINCMPAHGTVLIGDKEYRFEPDSAFGLLDWGRGVWPFHHDWYWGNGSCYVDGKRFGFNIGHGFGNTSAATENMLFYDGAAHKLGEIIFDLSAGGYMSKKQVSSDNGRFEMEFTPIYDQITATKLLFVGNSCHQLFGTFTGTAVLDDGRIIEVKDMVAFIEHASNNW
ncbi:DUF2804 domain-containing protein [Paenibacillus segetis]|uniref:DUF2804 domain-containing protein n=1 Tax=Paenibacillus segetis TaxID=1325360 RepID=A0ABQ1Y4B8_9BACL|nr:DUF2804 domain-containing protein [Paenibacillus segetis]GGH11795.1 hypothetical protein GCM10008013_03810 [Paenibacillus segetis]